MRTDPQIVNRLGENNLDSTFESGYKFHHGRVNQVIMNPNDLANSGMEVDENETYSVSQIVRFTSTYGEEDGFQLSSDKLKTKNLAIPLLRGFSDSIATGDSILYTLIGDKYFYLGPINTKNDPNESPADMLDDSLELLQITNPNLDEDGYSKDYKRIYVEKIFKPKSNLDRAYDTKIGDFGSDSDLTSVFSDVQLEGRHNNSIQLGTRFVNPYTLIKNNHSKGNNGSVLGMMSFGTLLDYFPNRFSTIINENNEQEIKNGLSSDLEILKEQLGEPDGEYKGFLIGHGNDVGPDENKPENVFNINFGEEASTPEQQTEFDQIIMFSDRITFDAQDNDFTVSAFRNINFGAVGNFTITNKGFSVIESKNIYIGQHAKEKKEPMVLGDELRLLLLDIMKILLDSRALVQGVALPLVDKAPGTLMDIRINQMIKKLEDMRTTPENSFLSDYHYIEPNAGNPNRS